MPAPLTPQGVLNRLRASVTYTSFAGLNVTASYLGREGISMSFEGVVTTPIDTMTGVVQSPEPYQRVMASIHLLKPQALAAAYKAQLELSGLLGDCTIRSDATTLGVFQLLNTAINNVSPLKFDGTDAGYVIMLSGIYYVNSSIWSN